MTIRTPRAAMKDLSEGLEDIVNRFLVEYTNELRASTPVATGRAKRGWKRTGKYKVGKSVPVIENRVPYIGVLDTGTSRQAPNGIAKPAAEKTVRRFR
tara:strand:- start:15 stop:308 length:294 start_codon:yes stop_codon:yes gene_type:complete